MSGAFEWVALLQDPGEFAEGVQRAEEVAADYFSFDKLEPVPYLLAVVWAGPWAVVGQCGYPWAK